MKRFRFKVTGVLILFQTVLAQGQKPLYKDPKQPVETRVKDLLSRMTPGGEVLAVFHDSRRSGPCS
ncbi:hypothetical protein [Chryseobacterium sp. SORGH_AS_1175]|uniref:hypothetical protein n=1 Tax=Chryseobacterium sp. SORGH_AS_1175 TaxID=3041760 RepID=UPI0028625B67|nr:hypothetical protein [Chryseobacterium sp. SORGH_AS_1175]MDR6132432.1 hypothetical protein [Chryseobacterium sp. SORGH_AS_1175]